MANMIIMTKTIMKISLMARNDGDDETSDDDDDSNNQGYVGHSNSGQNLKAALTTLPEQLGDLVQSYNIKGNLFARCFIFMR